MHIIDVNELTKTFKDSTVVDAVSFEVEKGEVFGFLGPNGAGKSTTINMLATQLTPDSGTAAINGYNLVTQQGGVRSSIGLVFQESSLDATLTAKENLKFHAEMYGVDKHTFRQRLAEVLDLVELTERKDDLVNTFSGGMKRRLEIARGLLHYPAVLFLDEPTIGLDPQTRVNLWDYILKLKREKDMTIFMTTHYMDEAEYCDRIAIMDQGRVSALDTPEGLKNRRGGDIISLAGANNVELKTELQHMYPEQQVSEYDGVVEIEVADGQTVAPHILKNVYNNVESISIRKPSLDDVFLSLTGRSIR